jgi:deoxyribodipyrimidine photo-lyase
VTPVLFEPTPEAAAQRLAAVRPGEYARTRNHLGGAVTCLSPYLTHGFLYLPDVLAGLHRRSALPLSHKLVMEFGWREFFHHAWRHDGEAIFASLHRGPLPDEAYAQALPSDVRHAATGVPAIDAAVRTLYTTGYLHNHARMWLASYTVHLRKVHWRVGADWLYAHLLDGDLASNHLSWQWVAGTGSSKPYLFNAGNVARYAPPSWHSAGSVLDTSYEHLDQMARSAQAFGGPHAGTAGVDEPALLVAPPASWAFQEPSEHTVRGQDVWIVHPWSLATPPPGATVVAVMDAAFHRRWPRSARRWEFVAKRMAALTPHRWYAEGKALLAALASARSVSGVHNAHLGETFARLNLAPMPRAFADPPQRCRSFSAFWALQTQTQTQTPPQLQGDLWT